jgi:alpha-L-glutamate ligase-like protein
MQWLFGARRLRERGILGMNRRNAECILDRNPARAIAMVDDKLRVHQLCSAVHVATPALYAVFERVADVRGFRERLAQRDDFVIKPVRGSGGRGVLVIVGRDARGFRRSNGHSISFSEVSDHLTDTLSGMHSLGGRPDAAMVQQRVRLHPAFEPISFRGIPDVRIVLYRGEPAMAMLRLPTRESNGRANLHQGGLGVGINLSTGQTHHAVQGNCRVLRHPDTGEELLGRRLPMWDAMLDMSRRVADAVRLGYLGVDLVLDPNRGPLLLEANARPGLAIQHANGAGLLPRLKAIDEGMTNGQFKKSLVVGRSPQNGAGAIRSQST